MWHRHDCIIDKRILIALCADRAAFDNSQIRSRCCLDACQILEKCQSPKPSRML